MENQYEELERIVVETLKGIREPGGRDLMEAGVVTGLKGHGEVLTVVCLQPGWPKPIEQRIEQEIKNQIGERIPQLEAVVVEWKPVQVQTGPASPEASGVPNIRHIIAVGSGKGGVGKSTIAASLAYALMLRGNRVGIMDADVYGPSIPHMLGIQGGAEVVQEPELRILPPSVDGIQVVSMGFLVAPDQAVIWRGPMLHKAIRDFAYAVAWGELDFLIVDLPPGTGDVVLSLSQQLPVAGGVIVCTPQDIALLDARKALKMFETVKIPCLGVVENMSFFICPSCSSRYEIFGHGGAKMWAEEAKVPFLGHVPINLAIRINGDTGHLGQNFLETNPARPILLDLADTLAARVSSTPKAGPTIEIV